MKEFSQLGIKSDNKRFVGDKIKMSRILNRKITVEKFKVEDSKYQKDGFDKCLHMQIKLQGNDHVVFTGSRNLIEMIQQVPADAFPFSTTIVKENEMYEFT